MIALFGMGQLALRQGNLHRALPVLERSISICHEADLSNYFSLMAAPLGEAYTMAGRVADAMLLLTQALEQSFPATRLRCLIALSEAYRLAERRAEARTGAEQALELSTTAKQRGMQAWMLRLLGDLAMDHHPPGIEEAKTYYQQAFTLAEELGMRPLQAHCHLSLGTLYSQTGQAKQARAELSMAIEMYGEMGMMFWLPQTEAILTHVE